MKIKTHTSKWAMALCAVAVFSFTVVREAQAIRSMPDPSPATIMPAPEKPYFEPLPPISPSDETNTTTVSSGTFTGTVIAD